MKFLFNETNMDLHIHTSYSDGVCLPIDIIDMAHRNGVKLVSITDHDTMRAYKDLDLAKARERGVKVVFGVEMSSLYKGHRVHVLGYNINPNLFQILKKVYYKYYKDHSGKYISIENAKRLIHLLGGKVILAHPYKYPNFKGKELVESIIKDKLVDGLECFHSYNTKEEMDTLLNYAIDNDLYISAGSDYHNAYRRTDEFNRCCDIGYLDSAQMTIEECIKSKQKIR